MAVGRKRISRYRRSFNPLRIKGDSKVFSKRHVKKTNKVAGFTIFGPITRKTSRRSWGWENPGRELF